MLFATVVITSDYQSRLIYQAIGSRSVVLHERVILAQNVCGSIGAEYVRVVMAVMISLAVFRSPVGLLPQSRSGRVNPL